MIQHDKRTHILQGCFTGTGAIALNWRHNERDGVSNHQPHDCLLNPLFRRKSKTKKSKLRVTGLCEGNSPVTGEFPAQRASNAANVSIWWRHHGMLVQEALKGIWRIRMKSISRIHVHVSNTVLWIPEAVWYLTKRYSDLLLICTILLVVCHTSSQHNFCVLSCWIMWHMA